jgi:RNA polymerase sigma-70 factor (ECF subfamily)
VDSDDLTLALAANLDDHFERFVRAYQDRIYGFALRLSGSPPDAEEIAQDAFVRAYRALARYPAEQVRSLALRPWLYQIAMNVFRNHRRGRRLPVTSLDGEGTESAASFVLTALVDNARERPDAVAERHETRRRLARLLAELPRRYRASVVLRHVEGLSYAEVAALLDQPVGTVKANVHRGIKLLRAALERDEVRSVREPSVGI